MNFYRKFRTAKIHYVFILILIKIEKCFKILNLNQQQKSINELTLSQNKNLKILATFFA